jgi:hypothetical protein
VAYASASDVLGYVRALIAPASAFSASTKPTDSEVTTYLSPGGAWLRRHSYDQRGL